MLQRDMEKEDPWIVTTNERKIKEFTMEIFFRNSYVHIILSSIAVYLFIILARMATQNPPPVAT